MASNPNPSKTEALTVVEAPSRVDYSPIIERPPIKWPGGARVALWIAPNIEHYEYLPDFDGVRTPWPRVPIPDVQHIHTATTATASASGA